MPSHLYCFSFEPNARWSNKFGRQGEIERYLVDCVERHGLAPHLRLGVEVRGAEFDDGTWRVATSAGELEAGVLVSGCGQLGRPRVPALPGLDRFAGATCHSARWDTGADVTGRNVVVIGSGASAAQIVPETAPRAARLTVIQQTPAYVIPRKVRAYRGFEQWMFRNVHGWRRLYRWWIYWSLETRFTALRRGSRGARWLDVREEAMARWNARLQRDLGVTAWAGECSSWYKTASGKITNNWSRRSSASWWQTRRPDFAEFEFDQF